MRPFEKTRPEVDDPQHHQYEKGQTRRCKAGSYFEHLLPLIPAPRHKGFGIGQFVGFTISKEIII